MAPRTMKGPNRASRRAAASNGSGNRHAIDVDAEQRERIEAPITVGGKVYHRRIKDNDLSMQVQELSNDQTYENRLAEQLRERADEDEVSPDEWRELQREATEHDQAALDKTYEICAVLLADAETGEPLAPELLKKGIDIGRVNALMMRLLGEGEPVPRPTESSDS